MFEGTKVWLKAEGAAALRKRALPFEARTPKEGSVGYVRATRELPGDPERMVLVKFKGYATPFSLPSSYVSQFHGG